MEVGGLVEFRLGDALHPSELGESFEAVVDSGFLHLFGADERAQFAQELAAVLPAGGRYYMLGFAISPPFPGGPKQVRESELRTLFAAERGWRVLSRAPGALYGAGGARQRGAGDRRLYRAGARRLGWRCAGRTSQIGQPDDAFRRRWDDRQQATHMRKYRQRVFIAGMEAVLPL